MRILLHLEAKGSNFIVAENKKVYIPRNAAEPGLCDPPAFAAELKWLVEIRKILTGMDFGEALKTLMNVRNISVERMESESGISVSTLKRLRAGQEATAEQIVAIAVALQLPPTVSGDLLAMCGVRLDFNSTKNTAYQLILASQYTSSIEQVSAFLETCGCKALKTAC